MLPLSGIRVLDLTRLLPGAVATMILGDFGADVVKVEQPGTGDPARNLAFEGAQDSAYFLATNRNKRSLAINLKNPDGRAVLCELASRADVLVESFRPGVMERLELDFPRLHALNRRLVYCAITGYGQSGPLAVKAGHDINYASIAGVLGLNGLADGSPAMPGVQISDIAGGSLPAVIGILLALAGRERSGEGQMVDVSMMAGTLALMVIPLAKYFSTGIGPERGRESLSGRYACYNVYETQDRRFVALGALEPKFWAAACGALGCGELVASQFVEGQEQVRAIETVTQLFRKRNAADWLAAFDAVDACLTLVNDVPEVIRHPQVVHDRLIQDVERIGPLIHMIGTPAEFRLPPPRLGEHTRIVLEEAGLTACKIAALAEADIIGIGGDRK
jgi:crotonobetainyl-CoA:carnitine CoA-transferase CaiB-like acyl-CoA transferase